MEIVLKFYTFYEKLGPLLTSIMKGNINQQMEEYIFLYINTGYRVHPLLYYRYNDLEERYKLNEY